MVFVPPRHGKSELASRRFPAWYLGRHPERQIIAASYNANFAADFGRDVRNLVADPIYTRLFEGTQLRPDSTAADRWNTSQGGAYVAAGVGTAVTGRGAHVALIDDPIKDREEADSALARDRVWHWYTNVLYTRLMPGGAIILIMTRWHEDDLAGRLLENEKQGGDKWRVVNLPAIADAGDQLGRQPGDALWPGWYGIEALNRIRLALTLRDGPRAWEALYQQRPQPDEGSYFKAEWIRWYDPAIPPAYLTRYGASDYAVTGGGGDYTVHMVAGVDPTDDIYVLDLWRQQATSDVWVESVIDLMGKHKPVAWAEEKGQIERGVGPFLTKRMLERRVYCRRDQFASAADKATRARAIQGRMSMGKVYLPHGAPWAADLVSELVRFPTGVNDDQVDALSLFGRMLEEMWAPGVPEPEKNLAIGLGDNILAALVDNSNGHRRYH